MGYLRIILALSVVLFHSGSLLGYTAMNGFVAVHVFFIISGFYMAFIIKGKYLNTKRPYYSFLSNRFLRIYPLYWTVLILTILLLYSPQNLMIIQSPIFAIFTIIFEYINARKISGALEDFTLLVRTDYLNISMFSNSMPLVSPAWTLVHELVFYIFAPFLVWVKKRYLLSLTFAFIVIDFLTSHYYSLFGADSVSTFFIPSNFFFFLFGIFSYYFYKWLKDNAVDSKYFFPISILFLLTILFWNYLPEVKIGWIIMKEWSLYFITPIAIPILFQSFARIPLNNFLADLSYPVYISHMLVITFLRSFSNLEFNTSLFAFWTISITVTLSICLIYVLEKPIDKFRQSRIKT